MIDDSWHFRESKYCGRFLENLEVQIRYQFLPYGATRESAKWVNYRVDYVGIPLDFQILDTALYPFAINENNIADSWLAGKDVWKLREDKYSREVEAKVIELEPIDPELANEEVVSNLVASRLVRYREILKDIKTNETNCIVESILTQAYNQEMANRFGFDSETPPRNEGGKAEMIPARVYVTVSASPKIVSLVDSTKPQAGVKRISAGIYKGGIITPGEDAGTANITTIVSSPITDSEFFMTDRKWVTEFTEDGVPSCCIIGIQLIDRLLEEGQAALSQF